MNFLNTFLKAPGWIVKNRFMLLNRWRFKYVGKRSRIVNPLRIDGIENIYIGSRVLVQDGTWLASEPLTGKDAQLILKDGVTIGHYNHIYATESIVIEKDVLTADKVYISDNLHSYEDILTPIVKQPIKQCNTVIIGEGSWLGENVCVRCFNWKALCYWGKLCCYKRYSGLLCGSRSACENNKKI